MFGKLVCRGLVCGFRRLRGRNPLLIIIWRGWRGLMRDVPRWVFEVEDEDTPRWLSDLAPVISFALSRTIGSSFMPSPPSNFVFL